MSQIDRFGGYSIASVEGLNDAVEEMFDHPEMIQWLDLSFNLLTRIEAVAHHKPSIHSYSLDDALPADSDTRQSQITISSG